MDIPGKFEAIKAEYAKLESSLKKSGKGVVYDTEKGIYGTTNLDNIFKFFKEINLESCRNFIDLGCGDGRVVLVAALFTKATGIEYDAELIAVAKNIQKKLGIDCELVQGDYLEQDISGYDIVFMNPDHSFGELDKKLKDELKGRLFIYNEIFAPDVLKKGKKYWYGQIPVIEYCRI